MGAAVDRPGLAVDSLALFDLAAARFDVDFVGVDFAAAPDFDAPDLDAADFAAADFVAADLAAAFGAADFAAPAFAAARGTFTTVGFFAPPVAVVSDFAATVRLRRGRTGGSSVLIRSPAQLTWTTCI
jgi:hypothetical protein